MATNEGVIDVDDQNDEVEVPEKENKPKLTSVVWEHFPYKKGAKKSKCNHCKKVLACGTRVNGTSGLLSHLRNSCVRSPLYKKKKIESKNQSTLNFKHKNTQGGGSLAKHSFSQEKCRLGLAKMCIKVNRPFSIVDDEGFREYTWELNPEFIIPSRWTVARDCISRWTVTYLMLETAVVYENAFDRLYLIDHSYGAYFRTEAEEDAEGSIRKRKRKPRVLGAPSGTDWDAARNMIDYLKIFSDVTNKISASKYVTSNIFFSELVKMEATITRMTLSHDEQKIG